MISLVQTSQNRVKELLRFVESLNAQENIDFSKIQLIFVDQGDCKEAFKNLNSQIDFVYIKYKPSSLSHARNVGLKYVKGEYIAFPDDDCWYEKDTLIKVFRILKTHQGVLIKATNEYDIPLAKYPVCNKKATTNDRCGACSITIFLRYDSSIFFDETIGVGSPYDLASGEETDYLINFIKKHDDVIFDKDILIHHPIGKITFFKSDLMKVYKYARGSGYLMQKHSFPIAYKIKQFGRPLGGIIFHFLKFDFYACHKSYLILKGRLEGYNWRKNDKVSR